MPVRPSDVIEETGCNVNVYDTDCRYDLRKALITLTTIVTTQAETISEMLTVLATKQDTLTAGNGIDITDNVISYDGDVITITDMGTYIKIEVE